MGSRDYRHRETKKPKKDVKKTVIVSIQPAPPPAEVEVIGKRRKKQEEAEEES